MECITATKTNLKTTLFFETAIKQGNKGDEKSDLSFTHQEYSSFIKMQNLKKRMNI
jgi:hypothetical protein